MLIGTLKILAENEIRIQKNINNKDQLIIHKNDIQKQGILEDQLYDETGSDKLGPLGLWNSFHVGVKNLFQLYAQASDVAANGGPAAGDLLDFTEKIADIVCRKEAYAKITKKHRV